MGKLIIYKSDKWVQVFLLSKQAVLSANMLDNNAQDTKKSFIFYKEQ